GVVGIDAASEGPFKKGGNASYLFNYRYSTLALVAPLLAENAGGIRYQDFSFKLNFPTRRSGTFSVWGMALADLVGADAKEDLSLWIYDDDRENHSIKQYSGVSGISHQVHFKGKHYLKTTLATTFNGMNYRTERLDSNLNIQPKSLLDNRFNHLVFSSFLNTGFSSRHTNRTGVSLTQMNYELLITNTALSGAPLVKQTGQSALLSAYTQSTLQAGDKLTLNIGMNAQLFTLNRAWSLEPRAGVIYRIRPKQSLNLGYGLHSRLERLNYYFIQDSKRPEQ
ncbi:MAG: TonB-dependent receptor, partial [Leadbetterella sp.]|nr:TonB-dependent receptor [Leadbetterella sp.]